MAYLRAGSAAVAAFFAALFVWVSVFHYARSGVLVVHSTSAGGASRLSFIVPSSLIFSLRFWAVAVPLFVLLFAASRISNKLLRVLLFWTPTLAMLTCGFTLLAWAVFV